MANNSTPEYGKYITNPGALGASDGKVPSYKSTGFIYHINQPLNYPISNPSDHFVRFFINLDEESKMVKEGKISVIGNVDQTDQTRLRNKAIDPKIFHQAADLMGGAWAAGKGAKAATTALKGFEGNTALKATIIAGSTIASVAAGAAGAYYLSKQIKIDKKLKRLATYITLYTPGTISNSQQTTWDNYTDVMADLLQQGSDPEVMKSITMGGIASSAGRIIATSASNLVQSATRTAVNPKKDLLFNSINRREFTFAYTFAPKSEAESRMVADIIQSFRLFSAPEVIKGTMEFLYTYPAEFDIEYGFIKDGVENQNQFLNKISSCVLKSVQVDYSPNGSFQTLENGEPVQVNMTLHFEEIETLHRDRIAAGY
jgi:hypothetical protein